MTAHHLIPRTLHRNKWFKKNFTRDVLRRTVPLCRGCHHEIHEQIPDEKRMGKESNTVEGLLSHPNVAAYAAWKRRRLKLDGGLRSLTG